MGSFLYIERTNAYIIYEFQRLFEYLNKKTKETIRVKYTENISIFLPHIVASKDYNELMVTIIKEEYEFDIDEDYNISIMANRRDYETAVLNVMMEYSQAMHYSQIHSILQNMQPQFKWKEQTVLHHLMASDDYANVGQGMYIFNTNIEYQ
jgi:hypothetical protein